MNRKQAEDFVYKSYLKAQQYQDYQVKDSEKRRNDLTYELIRKKSHTPCTVVTGSKGKGSVANMISQILQAEYTVGLMTSPHIVDFCERFQVNGGKIADEDFVKYMEVIKNEIEEIDASIPKNVCISPMGIQAYLALNYFEDKGTEFNVFECGKGAKFDDVNNIKHDYAVINSIFLEHTRELGGTIEEIAEDKAHVITERSSKGNIIAENDLSIIEGEQKCVYVAEQNPEVMKVIQDRADRLGVPLKIYGRDFFAENICYTKEGMKFDVVLEEEVYSDIILPLMGEHQAKNCVLAMALCKDVFEDLKEGKENTEIRSREIEKGIVNSELGKGKIGSKKIEKGIVNSELGKGKIGSREIEKEIVNSELGKGKIGSKKIEKEIVNSELREKSKRIEDEKLIKIKEKLLRINWPGRMEVINKNPFMLLDACIHGTSCKNVIEVLEHLDIKKAVFIIGIPDDKDYIGVVRRVENKACEIILTKSQNPHYVFTVRQQERLKEEGIDAVWTEGVLEAVSVARKKDNPIVILGTTSVIAEVKRLKINI